MKKFPSRLSEDFARKELALRKNLIACGDCMIGVCPDSL